MIIMNKIIKVLLIILLTILVIGLIAVFVLLLNNKIDLNISQSKLIYDENFLIISYNVFFDK